MKKLFFWIALLSAAAWAQTTTPNYGFNVPSFNTPNWNYLLNANFFQLDSLIHGIQVNETPIGTFTVGTLPTGINLNTIAGVTDAAGLSCTVGGGSINILCRWNGSSWVPFGITGYVDFSSNQSVGGIKTFTGVINKGTGPLNPLAYGGVDIGAQIQAAYNSADCPSTGCRIHIPTGVYGAIVSWTTPVAFSVAAKPAFIECDQGGQGIINAPTGTTQLIYSGAGAAFTFNSGGGTGAGMSGCTLSGPSSVGTTQGLLIGGNLGTTEGTFSNNDISGFGVGIQFGSNTYVTSFHDNVIHDNGKELYTPASITGFGENITFTGGDFYNKAGYQGNGIELDAAGDYHFAFNSFDEVGFTLNAANLQLDFTTPHFEPPVASTTTDYVTITSTCMACRMASFGGYYLEDVPSARTEIISDAGANSTVQIFGGQFQAAESVPTIVRFTGANSSFFAFGHSNYQGLFATDSIGALESLSCSNTSFPSVCIANHPFATNPATLALSTSAIPSHSCAAAQTIALAGVAAGSVVNWSYASTPIGVTGYGDSTTPFLDITTFATTNTANVVVCNQSAGSITPGAMSLNLRGAN